jgi:hypothetical protein
MDDRRAAFLVGDRPEDVAIYLSAAAVDDLDALADTRAAERVDDGVVLVVDGEEGRGLFQSMTGVAPMAFAKEAGDREGAVDRSLVTGACPDDDGDGDHDLRFLLSFVEPRQPEAGGRYAEGDVVHAYGQCECGTAYSERWVV